MRYYKYWEWPVNSKISGPSREFIVTKLKNLIIDELEVFGVFAVDLRFKKLEVCTLGNIRHFREAYQMPIVSIITNEKGEPIFGFRLKKIKNYD